MPRKHPLQMIFNVPSERRRAKKTHEQIERDLAEYELRGGQITVLPTYVDQPGSPVRVAAE